MYCPFCGFSRTRVCDTRIIANQVRRRRECLSCQSRFTTLELAQLRLPKVIKSHSGREDFSTDKISNGLWRALEKRPVSASDVEHLIGDICNQLIKKGDREVSSQLIGKIVMNSLKKIDRVAYVRFASVYRKFTDIDEFTSEVEQFKNTPSPELKDRQLDLIDEK